MLVIKEMKKNRQFREEEIQMAIDTLKSPIYKRCKLKQLEIIPIF